MCIPNKGDFAMDKTRELLLKQFTGLINGDDDLVSTLANTTAFLNEILSDINWVGFYIFKNEQLYLGPFQGKVACTRIALGKGVCGTALAESKTLRVDDVHQFPGHIVCDSASNSEIVIPIIVSGKPFGVLDIDAPIFSRFSEDDQLFLEALISLLETHLATL